MKKYLVIALFMLHQLAWADTVKLPLEKFTGKTSLVVRCINGMESVDLPLPERWKLKKLEINLHYTASNTLLNDVSQLVVKMNGKLVTQLRLNRQGPEVSNIIDIPGSYLKPGYNTLSFVGAQHYLENGCEQVCASNLWTNISLADTTVEYDYDLKPIPLKIGEVTDWIFDPKLFPSASVNLVADTSNQDGMTIAAMAASGIARRFDYRKVSFSHSTDIEPGRDNVLIGSAAFVGNILLKYGVLIDPPKGGLIRVLYLPKSDGGQDGLHALLVVTGSDDKALKIAAETFANMSLPYPGEKEMQVYSFKMPDISMDMGRRQLIPDKKYELKTLGMDTVTFQGLSGVADGGPPQLSFRLPADFMIKQNEYAKLILNFSYASGMEGDSALDISVNGKRVRDLHLNNPEGNYIDGYKVEIPTYLFKPGNNTIDFSPYLNAEHSLCKMVNIQGPFVTIYSNSTFFFPDMPHFVEMPKLELFTLNGFPFSRWPDGYQTLVYLPEHDSASIDTALNLIGMVTQRNGFPLFASKVVYSNPGKWDGEMLVVGELGVLPRSIMSNAPLQPKVTSNVDYPVSRGWDSEIALAQTNQLGGLGDGTGLLMEFQSPDFKGRSVIVATAKSPDSLRALGIAMLDPGVQAGLYGGETLINLSDAPNYQVKSVRVGTIYSSGSKGGISAIDAFLYSHTYLFYGMIATVVLLLSLIGYWLMRRYRKKRMKVTSDEKRE
jgi:hypothetical protein